MKLGLLYFEIDRLDLSFEYFQKAESIFINIKCDMKMIISLRQQVGILYFMKNNLAEAMTIF